MINRRRSDPDRILADCGSFRCSEDAGASFFSVPGPASRVTAPRPTPRSVVTELRSNLRRIKTAATTAKATFNPREVRWRNALLMNEMRIAQPVGGLPHKISSSTNDNYPTRKKGRQPLRPTDLGISDEFKSSGWWRVLTTPMHCNFRDRQMPQWKEPSMRWWGRSFRCETSNS